MDISPQVPCAADNLHPHLADQRPSRPIHGGHPALTLLCSHPSTRGCSFLQTLRVGGSGALLSPRDCGYVVPGAAAPQARPPRRGLCSLGDRSNGSASVPPAGAQGRSPGA